LLFKYNKPGVPLWVVDVASAKATRCNNNVNANLGNPFSWYNDNENILVKMLPKTDQHY
jgi:hypothetical protein